mmetsp:Transcript_39967/g.123963  ORF Transcript_39967/g.123963 Transcript_39967/m.123963 type:complete len:274 (-) Transcript_39967:92-913(-)
MAGAPGDLPYWGSIDAMHQFCEAKYVVSTHFAEIWNALSNIPTFILPGLFGLYSTWRVHDVRLRMLWLNMFWVGIGSFLFHMTMRFKCEMLDELPMVTLVLSGVFAKDDTHWTTSGFRKLLVHTLFLTVALVGMYLYISRGDYEIFCAVFTSLTVPALGLAFMCCFRQGGLACRLHLASTVTLSLARVLWELEARLCPPGRGGPLAWLHVLWHLLAGLACYFGILGDVHSRHVALGVGEAVDAPGQPWPLVRLLGAGGRCKAGGTSGTSSKLD